ncbi:MAG: hypothetical protein ACI978_000483 [Oleispira sp.]|jgi:hypothetical protein
MLFIGKHNMRKFIVTLLSTCFLLACSSNKVINIHEPELEFTNIKSDFILKDVNNYDCDDIDVSTLKYILTTSKPASQIELHDEFSTVGCSIKGWVTIKNKSIGFKFDYGGILYLDNGEIMACSEDCCQNSFKYCTWEKSENTN